MPHGDQPSAVSARIVDAGVLPALWNGGAVPGGAAIGALAERLCLPEMRRRGRTSFLRGRLPYWQCGACPHQCSLISGTMFESSKLPLSRWFLAMQLLTQSKNNVSALELMRQIGVSYRTAWLLKHKIMEAMRLREEHRELDGRVEIDDAYLGGEHPGVSADGARKTKSPSWPRSRPPTMASPSWPACASSRTAARKWPCSPPSTSLPRPPWSPTACGVSGPPPWSAPRTSASSSAAEEIV